MSTPRTRVWINPFEALELRDRKEGFPKGESIRQAKISICPKNQHFEPSDPEECDSAFVRNEAYEKKVNIQFEMKRIFQRHVRFK